jgi:class 3 adenylate cyclase
MDDPLMKQLQEWLVNRNHEPERAAEIDAEIWEQLGSHAAVLIIDMSGFTRTTREFGILHFLAMHRQATDVSKPCIEAQKGIALKQDADNLIAIFDHPREAIRAAICIQKAAAAYNRSVEYARQIGLCIGISSGRVLKTACDVFGDAVNVAYKLGEDIADPWEILVSDEAHEQLAPGEFEFQQREEAVTGKVSLGFRRVVFPL